jgi:hypothetical protein
MSPFRIGVLAAAGLAGPSLWSMVSGGMMDPMTALQRGAVVAGGTAVGAGWIYSLVDDYAREALRARALRRRDGAVVHQGHPVTPDPGQHPPTR